MAKAMLLDPAMLDSASPSTSLTSESASFSTERGPTTPDSSPSDTYEMCTDATPLTSWESTDDNMSTLEPIYLDCTTSNSVPYASESLLPATWEWMDQISTLHLDSTTTSSVASESLLPTSWESMCHDLSHSESMESAYYGPTTSFAGV